jgi:serine/threonine-protein kinase ULK/ATG1
VAVKVIDHKVTLKSKMLEKMMNAELKALSFDEVKNNQHIIKLYERIESDNKTYFVYEYCNGGSLQDKIDKKKDFTEEEIFNILK